METMFNDDPASEKFFDDLSKTFHNSIPSNLVIEGSNKSDSGILSDCIWIDRNVAMRLLGITKINDMKEFIRKCPENGVIVSQDQIILRFFKPSLHDYLKKKSSCSS